MLMVGTCAVSQVATSRIVGVVTDKTGALVPGATVTATNEGTNISFATKSSQSGVYSFENIQVGRYTITIETAGFKKFVSIHNLLQIAQPITVNIALEIGAVSETVSVDAVAELVQTSTPGNIGNVVDSQAVLNLPMVDSKGRNPLDLISFQPGVVTGANAGQGVYVHGARDTAWNYTLDGIDANENSHPGGNFSPIHENPDMIAEFRVVTGSPTAELGGASGGQVTMVTKSGTNQFHGAGFFYYQTPALRANPVNNKVTIPFIGRPQWVQKIPGGSIGGPIIKNKTFFFVNVQRLTTLRTAKETATVYTPTARQGIFRYVAECTSATQDTCPYNTAAGLSTSTVDNKGNILGGFTMGTYNIATNDPRNLGLNATTLKIINSVPLPNNYTAGDGVNTAGYTFVAPENEKQVDYTFKVDHHINDKNSVYARVSFGHQDTLGDFDNGGARPYPTSYNAESTYRTPRNFAFNWRITPNSSMTNEMVIGMNRFKFNFANPDPNAATNSPYGLNEMTMPTSNSAGNERTITTMQFVDNFSWARNKHIFNFGTNMRYIRHTDDRGVAGNYGVNPSINFGTGVNTVSKLAYNRPLTMNIEYDWPDLKSTINDMLGKVGEISEGLVAYKGNWAPPGSKYHFDSRYPSYHFYAQDSWRMTPNFVVNVGLRWEIMLTPRNTTNTILHPDQEISASAQATNTAKWVPGNIFKDSWKNFGPTVGFAWDPFRNGKTSVRGSYRLAYDAMNTFLISKHIFQMLPGITYNYDNLDFGTAGGRISDGIPTVSVPVADTPASMQQPNTFSHNGVSVMDPRWRPPVTSMWNFSIQRELPGKLLLDVNYIGHRATSLLSAYDANQVDIFKNGFITEFNTLAADKDSSIVDSMLSGDSILDGETGSQYIQENYSPYLRHGGAAAIAAFINSRPRLVNGVDVSEIAVNGFSPFYFTKFPQFLGGTAVFDSHGWSTYHTLEIQIQRRYRQGLQFQFGYNFAKSLDTGSFDPSDTGYAIGGSQTAGDTPQDIYNRRLNYARSDFDRRHVFQGELVADLPFGRKHLLLNKANGLLERIVGGWQVSSIITLETGRPMTPYGGPYSYTISDKVRSYASCTGCKPNMGHAHWENGKPFDGTAAMYWFTPAQRAMFSNASVGQEGSMGRNSINLPHYRDWDASISKTINVIERNQIQHQMQFRLEAVNVTNSVQYDIPYTGNTASSYFGYMSGSAGIENFNSVRYMSAAVRYTF
jgi:hypothetical protein